MCTGVWWHTRPAHVALASGAAAVAGAPRLTGRDCIAFSPPGAHPPRPPPPLFRCPPPPRVQNKAQAQVSDLMNRLNNALAQRNAAREEALMVEARLKQLHEEMEAGGRGGALLASPGGASAAAVTPGGPTALAGAAAAGHLVATTPPSAASLQQEEGAWAPVCSVSCFWRACRARCVLAWGPALPCSLAGSALRPLLAPGACVRAQALLPRSRPTLP